MTTIRTSFSPTPIALLVLVTFGALVAACTTGESAASTSPPASAAGEPSAAAPTQVPGSTDGSAPASDGPDDPVAGGGGDPGFDDPGDPEPKLVTPVAGLADVHAVGATKVDTALNGRDLAARVAWWSGVAPCYVLAGVDVARDGMTITLTVREGSAAEPNTACIEIAEYKATIVDLGELEPGTWTIAAFGDAPPVTVTID